MSAAPQAGRVSVLVVTYRCAGLVDRTLESLRHQTHPDVEVVVVDNASDDGTADMVAARFPEARLVRLDRNVGFAEANNVAARAATGEVLFLLNPDAWLEPDTVARLAGVLAADPSVGVVGGTVRHEDGRVQEMGNRLDRMGFPVPRRSGVRLPLDRDVFFIGGCALMVRTTDWHRLGGLDGRFFMFFEEVDLCWRVQLAGLDVAVAPEAVVWHIGGATLPGGYAEGGRHRTNPRRIYLRERNALASALKNSSPAGLVWVAGGWMLNVAEAVAFLVMRQPRVSAQYPRALWWNAVHLRETVRMRRRVQSMRVRPDRRLRGRARGSGKLTLLRATGVPSVEGG